MIDLPRGSATRGYSLIEILDRSFRIYRWHFLTFVGLSIIVQIPLSIFTQLAGGLLLKAFPLPTFNPNLPAAARSKAVLGQFLGSEFGTIVILFVAVLVREVLVNGPIIYITSEIHLGRSATLRDGFAAVRNRLQSLVTGLFSFYAFLFILGIALVLVLCLCGLGLGLGLYIFLGLGYLLVPVLLLERTTIRTAFGRAWTLGKARIWAILALYIGLTAISLLSSTVLRAVFTRLFAGIATPTATTLIVTLSPLLSYVLAAVTPIIQTELYYDVRNRFEGLDIALKSADVPNASPADVPSPAPGRLIGKEDRINIALFAFGILVIIVILGLGFSALSRSIIPSL